MVYKEGMISNTQSVGGRSETLVEGTLREEASFQRMYLRDGEAPPPPKEGQRPQPVRIPRAPYCTVLVN
jgi:hypothetical protein